MTLLTCLLFFGLAAHAGPADVALGAMKPAIALEHPSVQWVDAGELVKAQATPNPPLLLDVRTDAEWREGHLPGALHVLPGAVDLPVVLTGVPAQSVVVYCAVGARSASLAERLQGAGFSHVRNLEGGIFAWANAGLPLVKDGAPTSTVHPYNATWGRMLAPERHAEVEPIP